MDLSHDRKEVLEEINTMSLRIAQIPEEEKRATPQRVAVCMREIQVIIQRCYRIISGEYADAYRALSRAPTSDEIELIVSAFMSKDKKVYSRNDLRRMVATSYIGVWENYGNMTTGEKEKLIYFVSDVSPDMYLLFKQVETEKGKPKLLLIGQESELTIADYAAAVNVKAPEKPAVEVSSPFKSEEPKKEELTEAPF